MESIEDTTKMKMSKLLKLTNFAYSLPESKPRLHVRRISYIVTILDDEAGSDVVVNHEEPPSPEYQQVLAWQAEPEDLPDDVTMRDSLTQLSGKLCPNRNISTSIFDKVKADEDTQQMHPLSSYRHFSFRSAILTRHSTDEDGLADGQPELLFLYDGLGEQSSLRWRSHDYITVTLRKSRRTCFRVFWLIQWDIVDLLQRTGSPNVDTAATNKRKQRRSPSFHQGEAHAPTKRPDEVQEKFHGVHYRKKRKSPWAAELRLSKGKEIWLGNYKTREAAARAADAGSFYYNRVDRLNFRDSPQHLQPIKPQVLSDETKKKKFVKEQAKHLADRTEMQPSRLPSTWDPHNRTSYTANPADTSTQPATIQGAITKGSPSSVATDVLVPLQDSVRDSGFTDQEVHPHGGEHIHGSGCSTPENMGLLWLSTPDVSPTLNGICSSREAANSLCDDFPSQLWDEHLVLDISVDIAVKSAPSESCADQADDISGFFFWASNSSETSTKVI